MLSPKCFAVKNLTERTMAQCVPWEFKITGEISAQIRNDKQSRQEFYSNSETIHQFYSFIEGANPNQRPSKENPPKFMHGISADYDVGIPPERVQEAIKAMKVKPAWIERSLGGNVRLVWLFSQPLAVDTCDFCTYLLAQAIKWLNLGLLPALDEPAFVAFSRLLCNGGEWISTGHGPILPNDLQAFFIKCGRDFRFQPESNATDIPLDIVEKGLAEKFPQAFSWPSEFILDSQGPSFWIAESTSSMSAIVKKDGMFTFSGHASKPFFSWGDILGKDFVARFTTDSISRATADIYWDNHHFWRKKNGVYGSVEMTEMQNYFKVQCKLSSKPNKEGTSPVDLALDHIYNQGSIRGAAPFIFRPSGLLDFNGKRILNTWVNNVMKPADEESPWGPSGKFPFLALLLDNIFDPPTQLPFFLAWFKHYYASAYMLVPMPGPNCFLMGGVDAGKTLLNRTIIGRAVGGFMDASDYLMGSGNFNSEMFEVPLWSVDDETIAESSSKQAMFNAMLKKTTANQQFKSHQKFEIPVLTEWYGRIVVTTNLDYISSRALGPMDNSSLDKTNVFRCVPESKIIFPSRHHLSVIIENELPHLLRFLLNWEPPAHVIRHVRFGYKSYQDESLLDQAHQGGKGASFKEMLIEVLQDYFQANPTHESWRGSLVQLQRVLITDPRNDFLFRSLRLEQAQRYMEMIQREGVLKCFAETGKLKTRVWVFPRFGDTPLASMPLVTTNTKNPFQQENHESTESGLRNPPFGPPSDTVTNTSGGTDLGAQQAPI